MAAAFQLKAGHPVLDFVNTLDDRFVEKGPTELLPSYAELLRFAAESALIDSAQHQALGARTDSRAARDALRSAWELREALADIFYWDAGADTGAAAAGERLGPSIAILERHVSNAAAHRQLVLANAPGDEVNGVPRLVVDWVRSAADNCQLPVWMLAEKARDLLISPDMQHVHRCQSETCKWLFLDTSKNHSRRWCDMKVCGNRMKARRFQLKRAGSA